MLGAMTPFRYEKAPHAVRSDIIAAHEGTWQQLAHRGSWWTGAERIAMAAEVRRTRAMRNEPASLGVRAESADDRLTTTVRDTVQKIAIDAHKIDREWCRGVVAELGEAAYVELAAVVVQVTAIDSFAEALGVPLEPLPEPEPGEPDRAIPDGVGDIGAYVSMLLAFPGPNVARALSLAPKLNAHFFVLVGAMYAGDEFQTLIWDRTLSRPQIELVASRVSAVNECFY